METIFSVIRILNRGLRGLFLYLENRKRSETLKKIREWMQEESKRPGFINQNFPSKEALGVFYNYDTIIEECIKKLKETGEIHKSPFGDYSFDRSSLMAQ